MRKLFRWFKRLWRLANPGIVQVQCPTCNDLVDAYERHDCPRALVIDIRGIEIGEMRGRHIFKREEA